VEERATCVEAIRQGIASELEQKIKLAEEGVIHFLTAGKEKKLSYILYDFQEEAQLAAVWQLYAVPGLKVGRKLFEHTLEIMKDQGADTVSVSSLPNAVGYYKKLGFEEQETTLTSDNSKLKPLYKMVKSL